MPEEMESPTEHSEEELHHHAEHSREKWVGWVALTAAFLAALAAITGYMAGNHVNEAMIERAEASDKWAEYQAQKIKAGVKTEIAAALGKPLTEADKAKLEEREKKEEVLKEKATELEASSDDHLKRHKKLAPGVTMFQIAIALAAMTVLSKQKPLWFVSLAFGVGGIVFMLRGTVLM